MIVWVPPKKKLLYASRISRSGWMKAASLPRIGRRSGRLICAPILKKVLSVRIPDPALFLSCAADQSGAAGGAAEDRPLCMSCAFRQAISSFQLNFFDMTLSCADSNRLYRFTDSFLPDWVAVRVTDSGRLGFWVIFLSISCITAACVPHQSKRAESNRLVPRIRRMSRPSDLRFVVNGPPGTKPRSDRYKSLPHKKTAFSGQESGSRAQCENPGLIFVRAA